MDLLNEYLGVIEWKSITHTVFRVGFLLFVAWFFKSLLNKLLGKLKKHLLPHQTLYFGEASKPVSVRLLERARREKHPGEALAP